MEMLYAAFIGERDNAAEQAGSLNNYESAIYAVYKIAREGYDMRIYEYDNNGHGEEMHQRIAMENEPMWNRR